MAAHLENGPIGAQLVALAAGALTTFRSRLSAVSADDSVQLATCVHDTRRKMKWLRSLLRLVRPALHRSAFKSEDHALRDVGRTLADARAHVARKACLLSLADHFGIPKDELRDELALLENDAEADVNACRAAHEALERVGVAELEALAGADVGALAEGMSEELRRAKKAYRRARKAPTSHHVHEWRKEVKHHLHQLELVRNRSHELSERVNALKSLSELLGHAHDLADLRHHLAAHRPRPEPGSFDLAALLEAREAELSLRALTLGTSLFRQKPGELRAELERHLS